MSEHFVLKSSKQKVNFQIQTSKIETSGKCIGSYDDYMVQGVIFKSNILFTVLGFFWLQNPLAHRDKTWQAQFEMWNMSTLFELIPPLYWLTFLSWYGEQKLIGKHVWCNCRQLSWWNVCLMTKGCRMKLLPWNTILSPVLFFPFSIHQLSLVCKMISFYLC